MYEYVFKLFTANGFNVLPEFNLFCYINAKNVLKCNQKLVDNNKWHNFAFFLDDANIWNNLMKFK